MMLRAYNENRFRIEIGPREIDNVPRNIIMSASPHCFGQKLIMSLAFLFCLGNRRNEVFANRYKPLPREDCDLFVGF